jgi:hypothetical protein
MNRTSAKSNAASARTAARRAPVILLAGWLSAAAADAEVVFEETQFADWSTRVSALPDRTVSGAHQPTGGDPGAYYLVRHTHQFFPQFATSVVSASLSPRALDPAEIGLDRNSRLSVDLRFDADGGSLIAPTLSWAVLLQQGDILYRYSPPTGGTLSIQGSWVRAEVELLSERWVPSQPGPTLDLSLGALPVRLGLLLQSDVQVRPTERKEARIGIDNLQLETAGELTARVHVVAVPSREGGHVVFASSDCYGTEATRYSFDVEVDADRSWEGCVPFRAPNLTPSSPLCFNGSSSSVTLRCQDSPPTEFELLLPDGGALGVPSFARVEPCRVRVAGGTVSCTELERVCASELLLTLVCSSRPGGLLELCWPDYEDLEPNDQRIEPQSTSLDRHRTRARARADSDASTDALDTLRRVRDEVMAASPAGRYYRDLYDAFSPELRDLMLGDLRIIRDALAAAPPWIAALGELVDGGGDEATVTPKMVADMLAVFDRFEAKASPALREVFRRERARLGLADLGGRSIEDFFARIEERGAPPACASGDTALCLQGGRFRVEVTWTDFQGNSGAGHAVPLTGDSGYFWFFNRENIELGLKVLDGRAVNGRFWVFYGALSNVEYTALVTDTATGAVRAYRNPSGVFASVGDTDAFRPDGAPRDDVELGEVDGSTLLERLTADASDVVERSLGRLRDVLGTNTIARRPPGAPRLPAAAVTASSLSAPSVAVAPAAGIASRATCSPGANALCLAGGRFRVEVEWRDFRGRSGIGTARPLTSDTGSFWFFDQANLELFVKVLDARSINDHFWVFYGALSNVEYTLRVTDTETGAVRTYRNPSGTFASQGDVEAF